VVRNGYLKPAEIVTQRVPLEHGCLKPLVVPDASKA
jgi:hypothetical protein